MASIVETYVLLEGPRSSPAPRSMDTAASSARGLCGPFVTATSGTPSFLRSSAAMRTASMLSPDWLTATTAESGAKAFIR